MKNMKCLNQPSGAMPGNDWIPIADLIAAFDCRVSRAGLIAAAADLNLQTSESKIHIPALMDGVFSRLAIRRTGEIRHRDFMTGAEAQ